ncbi:DUF2470 domain-containing protein [Mycobacterium parmense]|uniref:Uncharacterized protein n=1 Tax=Mycobacterium parmense TaxID=185642 RepID=A0A7I7YYP4_9MYCO|nr:DUF2470 domain-containing protein [Mycobacterium parmense]MCV7352780.1 DUF2470 domain-containing protein [Mycobacterium parmense]ORW52752.1 prephenate dehydratase [Mycobacterium parmense]BBZ46789.1 hypothetical protein MPRM_40700 [Mycobacterium parmense]
MTLTCPAPTTAERIRSACARAGGALLAVEPRDVMASGGAAAICVPLHHLLPDGSFAVAVPADGERLARHPLCGTQALLELIDYAPLPVREPVRSLVWVRGQLRQVPPEAVTATLDLIACADPNPVLLQVVTPRSAPPDPTDPTGDRYALLRLEIASVVVTDAVGAEPVTVAELLAARPDPFCEVESDLLRHLDSAHNDVVTRLASRLPAGVRRGRVRLLGLDRYGMRFRIERHEGDHDVRLPFHRPVDDMTSLRQAIRVLMGCPFVNGLRARR